MVANRGASSLLANLPSRGLFSSSVLSSDLCGTRVYICTHDTSPPEDQIVAMDASNILIRSLTISEQENDSKNASKDKNKGKSYCKELAAMLKDEHTAKLKMGKLKKKQCYIQPNLCSVLSVFEKKEPSSSLPSPFRPTGPNGPSKRELDSVPPSNLSLFGATGPTGRTRSAGKASVERTPSKRAKKASSSCNDQQDGSTSGFSRQTLQAMTVERLRALLRERHLPIKGRKDELVSRLRDAK